MIRTYLLIVVAILGMAASCKEQPKEMGTLTLNFKALYDAEALVLYQRYATPDGDEIQFNELNFILSDIGLVNDQGDIITLSDHEYINFDNIIDDSSAIIGLDFTFNKVPVGNYTEVCFGVGVSPQLNSKGPEEFSSSSQLGNTGRYWNQWSSFVFSIVSGRLDTLSGAGGELPFMYHSGGDEMYQERTFSKNISIATGSNDLNFELQAKDIFFSATSPIDIPANNASHAAGGVGSEDFNLAKRTLENIANALSVQ